MSAEFIQAVHDAARSLGREGIAACHEVFLYGTGAHDEQRAAVEQAARFIDASGIRHVRFYKTNTMKSPRAIQSGTALSLVTSFFDAMDVKRTTLAGMELHSGESAVEHVVPSLDYFSELQSASDTGVPAHFYLRICLPAGSGADADVSLREIGRELARRVPIAGGQVGWSYYWSGVDRQEDTLINARLPLWLRRFPGVSFGDPLGLLDFVEAGLLGVGWLTYVSAELARSKGTTLQRVARDLGDAGVVFDWLGPDLIEVRTSDQPETGDVNRNQTLPAWGRAGRALSSLALSPDMARYLPIGELEFEERARWYFRFFGA